MTPSLTDDEIEDRYFLLGRMEILSVLNDLIHRREAVTVYFNGGRDWLLTTLLEAGPDALVFDLSGDEDANRKLPASASCIFVSRLTGIRVQFSGGNAQRFSWGGSDAFWIPLPERLVRVQRRESYRILLPVAKPLMASLYDEDDAKLGDWPAHDLSVGGLGLTLHGNVPFEVLQPVARLTIALTKQLSVTAPAVVRHVTPLTEHHGILRTRVGLSFAGLPPSTGVAIQRFIIKLEHQRRGLQRAGEAPV
jgi:c-di-GMP-binding flagellar brake protein YcgR